MSNLRSGTFGEYYGSLWGSSAPLNTSQMQKNATYIFSYLTHEGWTAQAIAGILGNMQHESSINPGRWEGDSVGSGPGYGLVQWTPYTNYTKWCTAQGLSDPSEMDNALARIIYELENGLQYFKNHYPYTFREFSQSTDSPYTLACAFAFDYERPAVVIWGANSYDESLTLTEAQKEANREALRQVRGGAAASWYTYLTGQTPTPPDPGGGGGTATARKRTGYNFVLFNRRRKIFT